MGRNGDIGPYSMDNVKIIRVETNNREANLRKKRLTTPQNSMEKC